MHTTTYENAEVFAKFVTENGASVEIRDLAFEGGDVALYAKIRCGSIGGYKVYEGPIYTAKNIGTCKVHYVFLADGKRVGINHASAYRAYEMQAEYAEMAF